MAKSRIHELAEEFGEDPKRVLAKLADMAAMFGLPRPSLDGSEQSPAYRPVPPDLPPKEAPDWLEYKRAVEAGAIDVGKPLDKPRSEPYGTCPECGHMTYPPKFKCDCHIEAASRSAYARPNNVGRGKRSR